MIAAIYARKSTDQNVSDEEKSVTRQVERTRAYAALKGWQISEDHIYVDDGISGAEFIKRPGFLRLTNALKPRTPFQVLVIAEEFRFGREQIETAYALKQLIDAGVRVSCYLTDTERTLDSATDKFMLSALTFAGELEREKGKQRTYDAMRRKAERGHVAGGIVYGYDNVRVGDHIECQVNPAEAEVIRRIFHLTADDYGLIRIAKILTARRHRPAAGEPAGPGMGGLVRARHAPAGALPGAHRLEQDAPGGPRRHPHKSPPAGVPPPDRACPLWLVPGLDVLDHAAGEGARLDVLRLLLQSLARGARLPEQSHRPAGRREPSSARCSRPPCLRRNG
jgi:DNA invertase Pin-like site-specific DNA recombinase